MGQDGACHREEPDSDAGLGPSRIQLARGFEEDLSGQIFGDLTVPGTNV
jgi:hypothetical protein